MLIERILKNPYSALCKKNWHNTTIDHYLKFIENRAIRVFSHTVTCITRHRACKQIFLISRHFLCGRHQPLIFVKTSVAADESTNTEKKRWIPRINRLRSAQTNHNYLKKKRDFSYFFKEIPPLRTFPHSLGLWSGPRVIEIADLTLFCQLFREDLQTVILYSIDSVVHCITLCSCIENWRSRVFERSGCSISSNLTRRKVTDWLRGLKSFYCYLNISKLIGAPFRIPNTLGKGRQPWLNIANRTRIS